MKTNKELITFIATKIKEFEILNQLTKAEMLNHFNVDESTYYRLRGGNMKTIRSDILFKLLDKLDTFTLIGSDDYGNLDLKKVLTGILGLIKPVEGSLDA